MKKLISRSVCVMLFINASLVVNAQIGTRFSSERKVVRDSITGVELVFLTSQSNGDSKIYHTHNPWTVDNKWIVFRSNRIKGEAMAVNEENGIIVQITEGGYVGELNVSRREMKLFISQRVDENEVSGKRNPWEPSTLNIIEVNLKELFSDVESGNLKSADHYQKVIGVIPKEIGARGIAAVDADEEWIYFNIDKEHSKKFIPSYVDLFKNFGPRNMGAGPSGIGKINLKTKEISNVIITPFQIGHVQSNPWVPGELVFCWETGGKAPTRAWRVDRDGADLRPIYDENEHDWVTHEVIISPDEVVFAIMGHRPIPGFTEKNSPEATGVKGANPGQEIEWGNSGTRAYPTGATVVNLRTNEVRIEGQTHHGSGLWHPNGSSDGRWLVGDDFYRNLYLIDRNNHEMMLLSAGHKTTAKDHLHPGFSPDGTRILIQSAMISEDGVDMNLCVVSVPKDWLEREYKFDFNEKQELK